MTRNEQEYYKNIARIARSSEDIFVAIERIANALEDNHSAKHAFTGMDGTDIQDKYANKAVDRILEGSIDNQVNETFKAEEQEELDTHHDYLHQLVRDLSADAFKEFCNEHCLPINDAVAVTNYITDLDYDECLGAISDLEAQNDLSIRYKKSDDQANEDAIELKHGHFSEKIGVPYDDDYDLRITARMYADELEAGNFRYKKDAILDYVTNEFGSQGARYTDIIKFAYYLHNDHSPKFGYENRGYYSCAMTHNRWGFGHLVYGGKDHFVKGINQDGKERYFALSHVESVTDYWKYCDNRKK